MAPDSRNLAMGVACADRMGDRGCHFDAADCHLSAACAGDADAAQPDADGLAPDGTVVGGASYGFR